MEFNVLQCQCEGPTVKLPRRGHNAQLYKCSKCHRVQTKTRIKYPLGWKGTVAYHLALPTDEYERGRLMVKLVFAGIVGFFVVIAALLD